MDNTNLYQSKVYRNSIPYLPFYGSVFVKFPVCVNGMTPQNNFLWKKSLLANLLHPSFASFIILGLKFFSKQNEAKYLRTKFFYPRYNKEQYMYFCISATKRINEWKDGNDTVLL
jgi:hypothetical protein